MKAIRLTHLHGLLIAYQQKSNFRLQQLNKRLPKHLLTLADGLEAKTNSSCSPTKQKWIARLRSQSETCEELTETIAITNDFVCDKLEEMIIKVDASIAE